MKSNNEHLSEDQIIHFIIDNNTSKLYEHEHFMNCLICQKNKDELQKVLKSLGLMALKYGTPCSKTINISSLINSKNKNLKYYFINCHAYAFLSLVFFVFGVIWFSSIIINQETISSGSFIQSWEDQLWENNGNNNDFFELSDFALPEEYWDMSEIGGEYMNDEFFEFILPLKKEEYLPSGSSNNI